MGGNLGTHKFECISGVRPTTFPCSEMFNRNQGLLLGILLNSVIFKPQCSNVTEKCDRATKTFFISTTGQVLCRDFLRTLDLESGMRVQLF